VEEVKAKISLYLGIIYRLYVTGKQKIRKAPVFSNYDLSCSGIAILLHP
jgi:hypothetical protein